MRKLEDLFDENGNCPTLGDPYRLDEEGFTDTQKVNNPFLKEGAC